MASFEWESFEWNLESVASHPRPTIPPFVFRRAEASEQESIEKVVLSAFSMEPALADRSKTFASTLATAMEIGFSKSGVACLVVQHGSRIIGASILDPNAEAPNHLLTGPAILHEYRSRGIGSTLLFHSLDFLHDIGLHTARGRARAASTVARHVYPKFGGVLTTIAPSTDSDAPPPAS